MPVCDLGPTLWRAKIYLPYSVSDLYTPFAFPDVSAPAPKQQVQQPVHRPVGQHDRVIRGHVLGQPALLALLGELVEPTWSGGG